ncbi:OmpA family protein [Roseomonas sp. CCTCC AB2023176]|uniref:OmpA family protein n=1 Tax=Roseomonas sp. CCTCC AB2023176 TaxID=3342640 RepID=UPI0035D6E32E
MSLKKALLAATMMSLPLAAQAQPVTGLYIAGGAGFNWLQSSKDQVDGTAGAALVTTGGVRANGVKTEWDMGWAGVLSIGYGFGNGVRAEIEGNYRENDLDSLRFSNGTPRFQGGRARSYGVMGNAFYDFNIPGFFLPVQPYVGVGAGYVWHEYDSVRGNNFAGAPILLGTNGAGQRLTISDTDGRFAYQGIAGVAFNLAPGLALTAEYRFLGTLSPRLNARVTGQAAGSGTTISSGFGTGTGRVEVDNYNHSVLVGLRYAFNAPRPAPVAAPAGPAVSPAVARTYLVFFDWDRADLTDRARQIVAEAANASRTANVTRIEVAGHADRSGTPQYNQRLSQRRAEVVAAELARNGVARQNIVVQAFGESRPLVPTADGVREPQNRRVEIVLR